jgi:putative DNA primase/helicase
VLDDNNIVEIKRLQEIRDLKADALDGKAVIIAPSSPLSVAREFLNRTHGDARRAKLLRHRGTFYRWDGAAWGELGEEVIRAEIYEFLADCFRQGTNGALVPVEPNIRMVAEVLAALKAVALIGDEIDPPAWLGGDQKPSPDKIVAFRNGLLCLPTSELLPATPAFFTLSTLDVAWGGEAAPRPERWLSFLEELWREDPESIDTLQRIFGYCLTCDTRLQKSFMIVGPIRSGKGTIGRVLTALLGKHNTVTPTLGNLGAHFGRASLIGKRLALVGDAKIGRDSDPIAIAEHILGITGEDGVTIPRKNQPDWIGNLLLKLVVLCTETPQMTDDSAGIAFRFIILKLTTSFFDREDLDLTENLLSELPGIAAWAVAGWIALFGEQGSGKITQPKSAQGHVNDLRDLSSDIKEYLDERCDFSPDYRVPRDLLYQDYCSWRSAQGRHIVTKAVFGKKLRTAFPGLSDYQPGETTASESRRPREYRGLRLRP